MSHCLLPTYLITDNKLQSSFNKGLLNRPSSQLAYPTHLSRLHSLILTMFYEEPNDPAGLAHCTTDAGSKSH